ncbi:hypothetical protein MCOR16_011208, partial [Pyricularia oryzae]
LRLKTTSMVNHANVAGVPKKPAEMFRWPRYRLAKALSSEPPGCRFRSGSFPRPGPLGPDVAPALQASPISHDKVSQICDRLEKHSENYWEFLQRIV